jgi:ADP-ribosylarginine hydrolase
VIIAYDALLGAGDSWHELVYRGILHGGDNDSTGVICGAWFGALYGLAGVAPVSHYADLEYRDRAEAAAQRLLALATTTANTTTTSAQRSDE